MKRHKVVAARMVHEVYEVDAENRDEALDTPWEFGDLIKTITRFSPEVVEIEELS